MTEPNEFGDRWCCEECKRLAEAAADETLAAAKLSTGEDTDDRDPMRGRFRDDPATATVIVVAGWLILACLFAGLVGLLAKLYPEDSSDIALLPYALVGVLAYCGWLCWRYRQFLVDGRDYPWRRR